jgi:hypothetical protein
MFAKIFESETLGQLLVKIDGNDHGAPEIRVFFVPEGLGVCSVALAFTDNDEGWDSADKAFDEVELEKAEEMASLALLPLR